MSVYVLSRVLGIPWIFHELTYSLILYGVWDVPFCTDNVNRSYFFFSSVVSTWNLWGKVLPNDCLDGQKEIRRIKVSSQEFFFPPKSSLFLYNRISHFYQPLFSKPWWEQPISVLFQRNTFLLDFTSAGSCSSCGFSSSITASSGCCRILIMRLCHFI